MFNRSRSARRPIISYRYINRSHNLLDGDEIWMITDWQAFLGDCDVIFQLDSELCRLVNIMIFGAGGSRGTKIRQSSPIQFATGLAPPQPTKNFA